MDPYAIDRNSAAYSDQILTDSTVPVSLDTPRQQPPAEFNAPDATNDYKMMESPTSALQDRTRLILDIIMVVLMILLFIFALDCLFVGSVRTAIFNKAITGSRKNWPKEVRRQVANNRFAGASGIIGGLFAFPAALIGLLTVILRKRTANMKKARIILGIIFILHIVAIAFIHFLTICVAMAIVFKIDTKDTNARGAAWLLIGMGQFLVLFHGGLIAFSVLRIIIDARQKP
jgi:hypothetical protein